MTTFQDIFKSSFLERLDSVSLLDTAIALTLAFLLGLFIFLVYKKSYSGVMYAPSFGVTLIALTLITTLLILAVTSNIVLSGSAPPSRSPWISRSSSGPSPWASCWRRG